MSRLSGENFGTIALCKFGHWKLVISKNIIARSFKLGQLIKELMSSIANCFKLKMTHVLKKSTILMDKHMVGGTVLFHINIITR